MEFSILFIKDISLRIRQSVALILLKEEERGFIIIGNKTLYFKKPIAIFNSKEDVANGVDGNVFFSILILSFFEPWNLI